MTVEHFVTNAASGFSEAVTIAGAGKLIYVAGNVGFGDDGKVVSGGMEAEARATFANIERTLAAAGATLSDLVKINAFITSLEAYPDYAKVRSELFGSNPPASATVQVAGLLVGAQIEIDAVAFVADSSSS